jgi:CPA1 family monovalent cation:H+ antiporter
VADACVLIMTIIQIIALLITLTALFAYLNHRFIRLPTTIGVLLIALVLSLGVLGLGQFRPGVAEAAARMLSQFEFDDALMQVMLSFLLFAGALHINLNDLSEQKSVIASLALVGVLLSMFIFGALIYFALGLLGLELAFGWCLLFGALISPTDPIAVLGILKSARVPKSLEIKIAGESLFNDGIGVVAFIVMHEIVVGGQSPSATHIAVLFLEEAAGGALLGLALGWVTYRLLKTVDHYSVEVLLTLALVLGGYTLATALHTSGPIAVVVAGLLIGNHGRRFAMSERTRQHLDTFWELNDEVLNALLFVVLGLEVLVLTFTRDLLLAGVLAVPLLLIARWISVGVPVSILKLRRAFSPGAITIMTWGGLRGGISVALALSLPPGREREMVLAITYIIVVFSIMVQGLTLKPVVLRAMRQTPGPSGPGGDPRPV